MNPQDQPAAGDFRDFHYAAPDGLKLHARIYGDEERHAWPAICLPGLTRNARDFHELALYLSRCAPVPRQVVAFDYRGRGQSQYDANSANYNARIEAGDILTGLDALGITQAAFIGTSRGGFIIHLLGGMRPAALKAIILNDIGPVIEAAGLTHIRSYLQRTAQPASLAEAAQALQAAHGEEFPALGPADWQRMAAALYRRQDGRWVSDFDPKLAETLAGLDFTRPLPTLWAQFETLATIPMLAIRGANSRLLSEDTLWEMARRHRGLETIIVEGQGHPPLLETGALPGRIATFLERAQGI